MVFHIVYIAEKSDTKLHVAHSTGKRVQDTADELAEKIKKRGKKPTKDEKATVFSDGNDQYTNAIVKEFEITTINYGQIIKQRERGRVVGKTRKIIFGDIDGFIDTVHIERYNLTVRHGISRLVRKRLCFFKMQVDVGQSFRCLSMLHQLNQASLITND